MSPAEQNFRDWAKSCGINLPNKAAKQAAYRVWQVCAKQITEDRKKINELNKQLDQYKASTKEMMLDASEASEALDSVGLG